MKKKLLFFIIFSIAFAEINSTEEQKKQLNDFDNKKDTLRVKLQEVANKIFSENSKIKTLKVKIDKLKSDIQSQQTIEEDRNKELENYQKNIEKITQNQKLLEENINAIIAKQFSLSIMRKNSVSPNVDTLIKTSILNKLQEILQNNFATLKSTYMENRTILDRYQAEKNTITTYIQKLQLEKENLTNLTNSYVESLNILKDEKTKYKDEMLKISKEQAILRKTLSKLKILKDDVDVYENDETQADLNNLKVRNLGSSFKKTPIKKYDGSKTIPPIDNYEIIKKFGVYEDPFYKIKIFNETIILRAAKEDVLVRSVLNGKVVFAQDTKVLGKIIILECHDQINIIYGHLSQIPSSIQVGSIIKKGSVIGRIKRDLTFGVTQQNRHINPLDLITS